MFSARKGSGRVGPLSRSIHFVSAICISFFLLQLLTAGQSNNANDEKLASSLIAASNHAASVDRLIQTNQSFITKSVWEKLISAASREYYSDSDKALRIYQAAIKVGESLNDKKLIAITYYDLGRSYSGLAKTDQSLDAYLQSKKYFEQAGFQRDLIYILSDIGTLYLAKEDYSQARNYSEQSILLAEKLRGSNLPAGLWPDEYGVAGSLSSLGIINQYEGDYDQAIVNLKKSLSLYLDLKNRKVDCDFLIADVLSGLGRINNLIGDNNQALVFFYKALEIAQKLNAQPIIASIQNSLGFLYMEQEDYLKATDFFSNALTIYRTDNNGYEIARVLLNLAVINQRQRQYDEALKNFNRIVEQEQALQFGDVVIAAYEGIGAVNDERGNTNAALVALDKGLQLATDRHNQQRVAELLWRKASAFYSASDYTRSAESADKAISLANQYRLNKISYLATTTLAKAALKQGKVELAKQEFSKAITLIERTRQQVAGDEQQSETFFEHALEPYQAMIDLLIAQNDTNNALRYAEMAKGRVLVDVFGRGNARISKTMSLEERTQEANLNKEIVRLNSSLREESLKSSPDPNLLNHIRVQLDDARKRYDNYLNLLYASHPELKGLRGQSSNFSFANISASVEDNQTLYLEYVVSNDQVLLFAISKSTGESTPDIFSYKINAKQDELAKKVDAFRNAVANRKPVYADLSRELYDLLIKPAANRLIGKKRICIVPDSFLWDVPFQALQSRPEKFLIEDFAVYYAPSITLLGEMSNARTGLRGPLRLIALGNPTIRNEQVDNHPSNKPASDMQSLPDAENEVRSLETIFGPDRVQILTGSSASETSFKSSAPNFRLIHIASHGIVDNSNPLYSYLLLAKTDDTNDGFLEAREIMNMNLQADLAVLSACETARGRVGAGEGVIGLSWSFFIAGCRTTVVSQWKVNSASTSELTVMFYKSLTLRNSYAISGKADALRNAALSTMKDPRFGHPFFWAAFVMVGSNQ